VNIYLDNNGYFAPDDRDAPIGPVRTLVPFAVTNPFSIKKIIATKY
jgi:hypothetical protein